MSYFADSHQPLHYSDGSHRWIAPPGINQAAWDAAVRGHQQHHRTDDRGAYMPPKNMPPHTRPEPRRRRGPQ